MIKIDEPIGIGRTANIYAYSEDKVVKVFHDFCEKSWIDAEVNNAQLAYSHQVKTPKLYEVVEVDNKSGIVYEYINGCDLGKYLGNHLFHIKAIARRAAELHYSIHQIKATGLKNQQAYFSERIDSVNELTKTEQDKIKAYMDVLPTMNQLCHGDLHVENYMVSHDTLYVIDWMGAYMGHPAGDIARTLLLMSSPYITKTLPLFDKLLVHFLLSNYNRHFLNHYVKLSGYSKTLINAFRLPVAAGRMLENLPHEKEWLLNIIRTELKGF